MKAILNAASRRELLDLLVEFEGQSRAGAKRLLAESREVDLLLALDKLRRAKLERNGQQTLPISHPASATTPKTPPKQPAQPSQGDSKAKKVPYTLLLPPSQLDALKALAEASDLAVSHHIRQAIKQYLIRR